MSKYLIAYHFANPEDQEYEDIPGAIYNIDPDAVCLFDNVWLLTTDLAFPKITIRLHPLFSAGDTVVITELNKNTGMSGPNITDVIYLINRAEPDPTFQNKDYSERGM